ncbi:hypothetical protein B2G71_11065 [Novosphingobium sp. PC22D]|uniref:RecX family transcriptional regulator n=1 Tax=Novosphingobium sp. PC22D TaxID=1962403 RepID=UPI000BF1D96A|nr:RecX family transcriptional regulator [Novosphingobium sp. PC22D]PEQ12821.1 hypothetical protein B2G71_11065 [Novosphingobium sp. PC22D]
MPRPRTPLDETKLEEMALAYVSRFATTRAKLEAYLRRKLRERGWQGEREPSPQALCERFVARGYVDDAAWARMKAGSLLRRGYGGRRLGEALQAAGISAELRADVQPKPPEARRAALALARRRRFGPFGAPPADPKAREKQIAAILRAGHTLDNAREIVDAADRAWLERWADETEDFA